MSIYYTFVTLPDGTEATVEVLYRWIEPEIATATEQVDEESRRFDLHM